MIAPKLRFSEFKDDWQSLKYQDVLTIQYGKDHKNLDEGNIPVYGTGGIMRYVNKYLHDGESILIGRKGTIDQPKYVNERFWTVDTLFFTKIKENAYPKFIYQHALQVNWLLRNEATGVPSLNTTSINNVEINLPSFAEQTKIAEFLSAVDDKISQLSRQLELLNQYKKGVMQKIFSQEIRFKNDNGEDFGEWEEVPLKEFLTLTLRPVDKPNENYHALGVRSHFKGLFNKYDSQPEKNSMDVLYEVFENDIVVNITFAWEGAMAIANKIHHKGLVSHRFPTYQTDESKILLNFFRYRFIQKDFLAELQLCSPGGAGRNRVLSKKDFLEISILKPSVQEQEKIAEFLTAIDERIDHTTAQLTHTKQWKKGLLQQMFI